jgi:hypothetical protein
MKCICYNYVQTICDHGKNNNAEKQLKDARRSGLLMPHKLLKQESSANIFYQIIPS